MPKLCIYLFKHAYLLSLNLLKFVIVFNVIANTFIANISCTKFYSAFYNIIKKMELLNEIFIYFVLYIYV